MIRNTITAIFALALAAAPGLASVDGSMLEIAVGGAEREFTEAEISALPLATIRTRNDFTDGVAEFTGPLARDVLAAAGVSLTGTGVFVAANDYRVEIPLRDFADYDVIFATSMNGARLTLRDKGPIWVIYPMSDHSELSDPVYNLRLIWQLVRIELD